MNYPVNKKEYLKFCNFVTAERQAGGPSANIRVVTELNRAWDLQGMDSVWFACCYNAVYNAPAAAALYLRLKPSFLDSDLEEQCITLWPTLPIHSNRRRTVGSARRLAVILDSFARWIDQTNWGRLQTLSYDDLWTELTSLYLVGRYFGVKLAGTLHRFGLVTAEQYDIRPAGAKNGRRTLARIFPASPLPLDTKKNDSQTLALVDSLAADLKEWMETTCGFTVSWFEYEALLCEYNQLAKGKRYPGSTSDSDLGALQKVSLALGSSDPAVEAVFAARKATHPSWALGEVGGWPGKRKDLLRLYADHGIIWSDSVYDYDCCYVDEGALLLVPREGVKR